MAFMGNMVAGWGMLIVETIAKVRRAYFIQQKPIKAICREFRLSRRVVRKVIRSEATEFHYERRQQQSIDIDDRAVFAPDTRLCTAPRWPRAAAELAVV